MTSTLPEHQWARSQARGLAMMFAVYGLALVVSGAARQHVAGPLRYLVTLMPVLPFAALPVIVIRSLSKVDERERALVYRSLAFAFFGTATVTFAYGFLEIAGAPKASMFWVWPMMATFWALGRVVAPRMP